MESEHHGKHSKKSSVRCINTLLRVEQESVRWLIHLRYMGTEKPSKRKQKPAIASLNFTLSFQFEKKKKKEFVSSGHNGGIK